MCYHLFSEVEHVKYMLDILTQCSVISFQNWLFHSSGKRKRSLEREAAMTFLEKVNETHMGYEAGHKLKQIIKENRYSC